MNPQEIEAIQHAFGLDHIKDPVRLRAEIESRFSKMNALDKAAVKMKIGTRMQEIEARLPGEKYSPPTWTLILVAHIFIGIAAVATYVVLASSLWLILKVALGVFALVWFLCASRAMARVIFRIANGKDI